MSDKDVLIGKLILKYRTEKGLSQTQVVEMIGKTDRSTVSRWESGNRSINLCDFLEICQKMGCNPKSVAKDLEELMK